MGALNLSGISVTPFRFLLYLKEVKLRLSAGAACGKIVDHLSRGLPFAFLGVLRES